jgi:hypothetical protein
MPSTLQFERSLPDGNPPSGVASGYVWFDVTALLVAARLLALLRQREAERDVVVARAAQLDPS